MTTTTSFQTEHKQEVQTGLIQIQDFTTQLNAHVKNINIFYHSWGQLNKRRDNAIWICHGLTADSNAERWWPGLIGPGKTLDTNKYFIVCPNIPGSCYGSSQPAEIVDSKSGKQVQLNVKDIAQIFEKTAFKLGINKLHLLTGVSIGGFIALEWSILSRFIIKKLGLIATSYYASPWSIAINQAQLMAIENSPNNGLETARAIAMLSYRNWKVFNRTQFTVCKNRKHNAATYQRYQGKKLAKRFSTNAYKFLLNIFDSHDVADKNIPAQKKLSKVKASTLILGFSTDILFPVEEQDKLAGMLPKSTLHIIDSDFGHDAFLIETIAISKIIYQFLNK